MYLLGLRALGHEVFYIEDTGECVYDPVQNTRATDPSYGTSYIHNALDAFGLGDRWTFVNYDGSYHVKSRSFGILKLYVRSGRWIVPRTIFFVIIFGILTGGFLALTPQHSFFITASIVSASGLAVAIYETVRFYKVLPRN